VAGRLAAAPGHGGNGTRSKITQAEELLQELGSLGLQSCKIIRHRGLLSVSYLICTYRYVQNNATKNEIPLDASSRSRTHGGVCPWNVTELDAHYWDTPPDPALWDAKLRQAIRPRPDDFIPWLLRPQSEHYAAQEKARDLDIEVNEDRRRSAVSWLKTATGQSIDSPETWVRWWQENRSNLVLSEDGLKLVIKRR